MQFSIDPVAAVAAAAQATPTAAPAFDAAPSTSSTDAFARIFSQGLGEVNSSVSAAERAMSDLSAGKPVELHEVMISLERAQISVQTFVQVRNKLVESYQDLMRMQL
jgi:flagellar hook-basal body complex protein FliE